MSSVNLIVIIESLRTIIDKEGDDLIPFYLPSIIAVAVALGMCLDVTQHHYIKTYVCSSY